MDDIFTLARDMGAVAGVRFPEVTSCTAPFLSFGDPAPLLQLFLCVHHQQGVCGPREL